LPAVSTPDRLEPAASGRAKCRACGGKIAKGELRFGEVLPSAYGGDDDGAGVFWFHLRCAAHRRPEKLGPLLRENEAAAAALPDRAQLLAEADEGIAHARLPRVGGAERASSGRARCRQCQQLIAGGAWRIRLSSFGDSGFFDPLGFIHAACAQAYFGTGALAERLRQASPELDEAAVAEASALAAAAPPAHSDPS
jgi:hypothetical protein